MPKKCLIQNAYVYNSIYEDSSDFSAGAFSSAMRKRPKCPRRGLNAARFSRWRSRAVLRPRSDDCWFNPSTYQSRCQNRIHVGCLVYAVVDNVVSGNRRVDWVSEHTHLG